MTNAEKVKEIIEEIIFLDRCIGTTSVMYDDITIQELIDKLCSKLILVEE